MAATGKSKDAIQIIINQAPTFEYITGLVASLVDDAIQTSQVEVQNEKNRRWNNDMYYGPARIRRCVSLANMMVYQVQPCSNSCRAPLFFNIMNRQEITIALKSGYLEYPPTNYLANNKSHPKITHIVATDDTTPTNSTMDIDTFIPGDPHINNADDNTVIICDPHIDNADDTEFIQGDPPMNDTLAPLTPVYETKVEDTDDVISTPNMEDNKDIIDLDPYTPLYECLIAKRIRIVRNERFVAAPGTDPKLAATLATMTQTRGDVTLGYNRIGQIVYHQSCL